MENNEYLKSLDEVVDAPHVLVEKGSILCVTVPVDRYAQLIYNNTILDLCAKAYESNDLYTDYVIKFLLKCAAKPDCEVKDDA